MLEIIKELILDAQRLEAGKEISLFNQEAMTDLALSDAILQA